MCIHIYIHIYMYIDNKNNELGYTLLAKYLIQIGAD